MKIGAFECKVKNLCIRSTHCIPNYQFGLVSFTRNSPAKFRNPDLKQEFVDTRYPFGHQANTPFIAADFCLQPLDSNRDMGGCQ